MQHQDALIVAADSFICFINSVENRRRFLQTWLQPFGGRRTVYSCQSVRPYVFGETDHLLGLAQLACPGFAPAACPVGCLPISTSQRCAAQLATKHRSATSTESGAIRATMSIQRWVVHHLATGQRNRLASFADATTIVRTLIHFESFFLRLLFSK